MTDVVEKARGLDSLKESPKKDQVFIITDYNYLNSRQTVFLDLRNGFEIYGYDGYGDDLDVNRRDVPQEVLDLESFLRAEGSKKLSNYA